MCGVLALILAKGRENAAANELVCLSFLSIPPCSRNLDSTMLSFYFSTAVRMHVGLLLVLQAVRSTSARGKVIEAG